MAQEKRPWWSIKLWGGKQTPPPSEPAATQAPEAGEAPAPEQAPAAGPAPQPQARAQDVSHAFEDLMARYEALMGQTQSPGGASSMAVVHRLLAEAEREAANLKARARRQAEVEAAPLLAEAKRQAQDTIAHANREAQRITELQVGTILDDAHRRAELIEERAKQAAQVFLMRCREDVQNFVAMEAKEAFYKLLAPVNEVLATAQEVESTWKMRAVDLWQSAAGQLEDYQNTLFGTLGTGTAGVAADEPLVGEALDVPLADEPPNAGVIAAEGVLDETEVLAEHVVIAEDEAPASPEPAAEAGASPQAPVEAAVVDTEPAAAETPSAEPEAAEAAAEPQAEEPKGKGRGPARSQERKAKAFTPVAAPSLYEGMLDLLIEPFTNVAKISKFYSELGTVAGVRVLRTSGSWDKGTVITVELSEPMSPETLTQRLPSDVQATPARMEEDGWWRAAMGRRAKGPGAHDAVAIAFAAPPAAKADAHDHDHADEGAQADRKAEA